MRKHFLMVFLILILLTLNALAGISYAIAENADGGLKAPVAEPVRGSFSSEEARADRAEKLKAKIKGAS